MLNCFETMENIAYITPASRCLSCLSRNDEKQLQTYSIRTNSLISIFQTNQLILCYICKKVARNAERFIYNVETALTVFKGFKNLTDEDVKSTMKLATDLTVSLQNQQNVLEIKGFDPEDEEKFKIECDNNMENVNELPDIDPDDIKQEQNYEDDNLENFINSIETDYDVKDDRCLLKIPKEEPTLKKSRAKRKKKVTKAERMKKKENSQKTVVNTLISNIPMVGEIDAEIEALYLSTKQILEEREQKRLDKSYLDREFRCPDCLIGFSYKPSFDKHMKLHNKVSGDYVCGICKLRFASQDKLDYHQKRHTECTECDLTRACRETILSHIWTVHGEGLPWKCQKCDKAYKCKKSLRKHLFYAHKDKITCEFCNKLYANRESLKAHVRRRHPAEVSCTKPAKKYECKVCGMAFESPSRLKIHSSKHSQKRDFYCVECDKSFKTHTGLQQHLKTVSVHVKQEDLRFTCHLCTKRFRTKSHVNRHVQDVHIKSARFYCDQCGKEFKCKYKLAHHLRAHEGYEKPRRFFCSICNKGFQSKAVLDGHVRIHTGEKPFHCPACPAQFNQYGSLYNHKKLVHKISGKSAKEEATAQDIEPMLGKQSKIDDVKF